MATVLFFCLAKKWPHVASDWMKAEQCVRKYGKLHLTKKFKIVTAFIMILGLGKYSLLKEK